MSVRTERNRGESVTINGRDFEIWKWAVPAALSMLAAGMMWMISSVVDLNQAVSLLIASDQDQAEQIERHEEMLRRIGQMDYQISSVATGIQELRNELATRTASRYTGEMASRDWAVQERTNSRVEADIQRIVDRLRDLERGASPSGTSRSIHSMGMDYRPASREAGPATEGSR